MPEKQIPRINELALCCTGCGACCAICPFHCIEMRVDGFGFRYPHIDLCRCVKCGSCDNACPCLDAIGGDAENFVYWAKSRDSLSVNRSSSGGVFGVIADCVLSKGGVVYGAAFTDKFDKVRHVRINTHQELDRIRRSKYVQSNIDVETFKAIKDDIQSGIPVLFSGVACQTRAVMRYLAEYSNCENFFVVDVVCHGVPSPRLWTKWISYLENSKSTKLDNMSFRDKSTGWKNYSLLYAYKNGQVERAPFWDDWYMGAFLNNYSLRPSCFNCPSKRSSGSDITLGDFWGVEQLHTEVPDIEEGVSAVIINTDRGATVFDDCSANLHVGDSTINLIADSNPSLISPPDMPSQYWNFMNDLLLDKPIKKMMRGWKFGSSSYNKIIRALKKLIKRLHQ